MCKLRTLVHSELSHELPMSMYTNDVTRYVCCASELMTTLLLATVLIPHTFLETTYTNL